MENNVNYTPSYGEQTHRSELCATCHTLFTPYVDNNGNIVGEAPEQTPYLEWKNSVYPQQDIHCQSCHMPDLDEAVVISNRPQSLSARSPFARHYFVGGNVYMLNILKKYGDELGVTATSAQFDSTIKRTMNMLQNETADLDYGLSWVDDTLAIDVSVLNKTGHKFPTAYPSRRAWINVQITDPGTGNILWESGAYSMDSLEIKGLDNGYEPHHDIITQENQIAIYQSIMRDIDGKVNYVLLRAAGFLKDNRLPPAGFSSEGPFYDSTHVEGLAQKDPDFNANNSGSDKVHYRISGLNPALTYNVKIRLYYQSLTPRYVNHLLSYDTPEVNRFRSYYEATPNAPVVVDSLLFNTQSTGLVSHPFLPESPLLIKTYPNPFNPEVTIHLSGNVPGNVHLTIYDLNGRVVHRFKTQNGQKQSYTFKWTARDAQGRAMPSGIYLVQARVNNTRVTRRIVLLK